MYCQIKKYVLKYRVIRICGKCRHERRTKMKAVITVTGKDRVGIISMASAECSKHGINIIDISQTVMKEYCAMIMLVELDGMNVDFSTFSDNMKKTGEEYGVDVRVMHEDIFNTMHKI